MKVTPLDLRQQRFQTVMRGYDRGEVQAFMLEVADDYENALRECDKLRQDVAKLDAVLGEHRGQEDRKSTRLNSSHSQISYAVFCLKKKKYIPIQDLAVADN